MSGERQTGSVTISVPLYGAHPVSEAMEYRSQCALSETRNCDSLVRQRHDWVSSGVDGNAKLEGIVLRIVF